MFKDTPAAYQLLIVLPLVAGTAHFSGAYAEPQAQQKDFASIARQHEIDEAERLFKNVQKRVDECLDSIGVSGYKDVHVSFIDAKKGEDFTAGYDYFENDIKVNKKYRNDKKMVVGAAISEGAHYVHAGTPFFRDFIEESAAIMKVQEELMKNNSKELVAQLFDMQRQVVPEESCYKYASEGWDSYFSHKVCNCLKGFYDSDPDMLSVINEASEKYEKDLSDGNMPYAAGPLYYWILKQLTGEGEKGEHKTMALVNFIFGKPYEGIDDFFYLPDIKFVLLGGYIIDHKETHEISEIDEWYETVRKEWESNPNSAFVRKRLGIAKEAEEAYRQACREMSQN